MPPLRWDRRAEEGAVSHLNICWKGLRWLLLGAAVVISAFPWTSGSREGGSQGSKILEEG